MSELVEKHLESMSEEIEEMRRTRLFSLEETKLIIKKRKHYEYKINGVSKNLQDYKEYIQYEKIILKDIKIRRNKMRIPDKKGSIEFKIKKRIKALYEIAVQRYDNDFNLVLAFFNFCKDCSFHQTATLVVQNMMKNFSQVTEAWLVAVSWYMKRDINEALTVIHKGLAIHKTSQRLYREAIELELENSTKDDKSESDKTQNTGKELVCTKINTYLDTAFNHINDYQFSLDVLEILEKYAFTKEVQDTIIKKLLNDFPNEEDVWDALAQREYKGLYYDLPVDTDEKSLNSTKFRLKRCATKYEMGLEKLNAARAPELWIKYIDWLIEVHQQKVVNEALLKTMLLEGIKKASEACPNLPERYYIIWSKIMTNEEDILRVLDKGLTLIPNSLELWKLKLKHAVLKDNIKEFNSIFKEAITHLKEKATPLWIMALRYHSLSSNNRVLESIYRQGVTQLQEVSDVLKPEYIQWLALSKGITDARNEYKRLAVQKPYCKELHMMMANMEQMEMEVTPEKLEDTYQLLCEQFGDEDSDVWIMLVQFYFTYHRKLKDQNESFDLNETILKIYNNVDVKMKDNRILFADFKEKFDRMRQEFSVS